MNLHHIFMTRFNLATPGREAPIRNQPRWLAERFDLFERYCLPSVAAQTTQNFDWIIYFDEATPDEFQNRISALQRNVFPFHAFYTPMFGPDGWRSSIVKTYGTQADRLLTSRLDNDDAISVDFVDRLHTAVAESDGKGSKAFNFRNGIIRRGPALYAMPHDRNPFFSWIEPMVPSEIRTAMGIRHMEIHDEGQVSQIEGAPAWMQVVHGTNVSNRVRGSLTYKSAAQNFVASVRESLEEPSWAHRIADTVLTPFRSTRDRLSSWLRPSRIK